MHTTHINSFLSYLKCFLTTQLFFFTYLKNNLRSLLFFLTRAL